MSSHFLVTGGAGFIGSNLVHTLTERFPLCEVTVLDDFRSGSYKNLEGFKGDFITGDISRIKLKDALSGQKFDTVFHLASITDTTDHDQFRQTHDNVEGFRNLLEHFAGKKTRIVYASSAATYGIAAGVNKVDQLQKPANVYAFSKVQLENLARLWAAENSDQTIVGLRYFNVYGPRETHKLAASSMIYQLAQQMKAGKAPRIFRDGTQMRDFVYVKDIVAYTIAAATNADGNGVYNAGSGKPRSFNDIVTNLNRVLKTDYQADFIDNPYAHYQPHTEADLEKTIPALKAEPQFTLEAGVDDYLASGWL